MNYKLEITYREKPTWLLMAIGVAKGYLDGTETFDGATSVIESALNNTTVVTRNTSSSGSDIRRELDYDARTLTIMSQNQNPICIIKYIENE